MEPFPTEPRPVARNTLHALWYRANPAVPISVAVAIVVGCNRRWRIAGEKVQAPTPLALQCLKASRHGYQAGPVPTNRRTLRLLPPQDPRIEDPSIRGIRRRANPGAA